MLQDTILHPHAHNNKLHQMKQYKNSPKALTLNSNFIHLEV